MDPPVTIGRGDVEARRTSNQVLLQAKALLVLGAAFTTLRECVRRASWIHELADSYAEQAVLNYSKSPFTAGAKLGFHVN